MSYGPVNIFSTTIASGADSAIVNVSKSWGYVALQVGTMSTAAQIAQWASVDNSTFYQVFSPQVNTATVANNAFLIVSGIGTNGGVVPVIPGFQYYKFITSGVVSGGVQFKVICADK